MYFRAKADTVIWLNHSVGIEILVYDFLNFDEKVY